MDWLLFRVKARRICRRLPNTAWEEFVGPVFNRGQILMFLVALVATALLFQTADFDRMDAEITSWSNAVQAFCYVLLVWALISAARAPFLVVAHDRQQGQWFNRRFVYIEPKLVKMILCAPTGKPEYHEFIWPDAEPGSFVNYEIVLDGGNMPMIKVGLYGRIVIGLLPVGQSKGQSGGLLLPKDNRTVFAIDIDPQSVSSTARIYCKSFSIGNPDDKDGSDGNRASPFRQSPKGHDRP